MTPNRKPDAVADAPDDEWTTPDADLGDADEATTDDQPDPEADGSADYATAPTDGKLRVEATAYVTIGTTTYGPTAAGETVEVADNAESRSALAAGFLRFPSS